MPKRVNLGWGGNHVGKLHTLQTAVRILAEGRGKTAGRLEKATFALVGLRPEDFPPKLRKLAKKVLALRGNAAAHIYGYTQFRFYEMTVGERVRFVADLLDLHNACLIDIGRSWPQWSFMYPSGEAAKPRRRRRRGG